jgi:hypothetical protein
VIDEIERAAIARWEELALPGPRPVRLAFALDARDGRRHGCARYRAFRPGDAQPIFQGKIPRDGVARRAVRAEHELLRDLAEEAPGAGGRLFPRALFAEERAGGATAETILPGGPPADPAAALDAAERWLSDFWNATGILDGTAAAVHEPYVRAARAALDSAPPGAFRRRLADLADELEGRAGTARCACAHGDLRASRLVVASGDRAAARDWEQGGLRQPAWSDPVSLALDVAIRGARPEAWTEIDVVRAFRESFLGGSAVAGRLRAFLAGCFARAGLPPETARLAVPSCALLASRRTERDRDAPPDAWAWLAVARDALDPAVAGPLADAAAETASPV